MLAMKNGQILFNSIDSTFTTQPPRRVSRSMLLPSHWVKMDNSNEDLYRSCRVQFQLSEMVS